ncbi:MAG: homoserine dehydrogenase [Gemmatimonadaceae bacterium]
MIDELITLHDLELEHGQVIERVDVRYRLEGAINPARDNVVLVIHALTGTPEASDWWTGVIGDDEVLNPRTHAILCANLLGGCAGSTGPSSNDTTQFPNFTTRDQALVLARLLNALGVNKPALICGGSLGGMVALEFAASFPERVRQAVVLAAPAVQTAQGLAWHAVMRRAIVVGGETEGLALARMVGMLSYRTADSLESRFANRKNEHGVFGINEWLHAHGEKLVKRFDARSYVSLIDAMDEHDVGRNRGGVAAALKPVASRLIGVGIPGDILFSAESVRDWCAASGAEYCDLPSPHGHDAFLLEAKAVSGIIHEALVRSALSLASEAFDKTTLRQTDGRSTYRAEVGSLPNTRPLRVALAGCGHVGSALLDLFAEQSSTDRNVEVTGVLVRDAHRDRPSLRRSIESGLSRAAAPITDAHHLLDGDVDVLVELIGGTTTAHSLVQTALGRGIRVVSANKALLGSCGPLLTALAAQNNTTLDYEGAVAAAVPVIRCLRSGAAGTDVHTISGILNGTTNVVLERVSSGESLADAVAFAQREGFAEADPTRDLSGQDAEDKLRVLAWLAFGVNPAELHVERAGINEETARWAASAARDGNRVKLIATVTRTVGGVVARVAPEVVRADAPWATVDGPSNRVVIESHSQGSLVLQGAGAGGRATAGAVYHDIFHPVI